MKKWICYNLFGEHPDSVDAFGMVSGLVLLSFLLCCVFFLFVPFIVG